MAIATPENPTETGTSPIPTPPVRDAGIDLDWLSKKIDYRLYQDCIHCGLCTASCPTYVETGNENDGPRGRIYLMRGGGRRPAGDEPRGPRAPGPLPRLPGLREACPSGVQYGKIIEPFKVAIQNSRPAAERAGLLERLILHHLFPHSGRVKAALAPAQAPPADGRARLGREGRG